jgi:hypothetical protein
MDTIRQVEKKLYHVSIDKQPSPKGKTLFGADYDTLTLLSGILVPLISFFLGFVLSVLRDRFREQTNLKIASDSFFLWMSRTIKSSDALLLELEKRKNEATELDSFQISKPDFINLHLNRLLADQNLLYKAFVKLKSGDQKENFNDYSKIIVAIDFIDDFQKMLLQNSQYLVEDFQNLFIQWNTSVKSLHRAKHNLLGRRFRDEDAKLNVINDSFNEWYKSDEQGLSNTYQFLEDIEPILQDFYQESPNDDELSKLLSITQQTKVIYKQFIFERGRVCDLLSNFYKQLKETLDEIRELSQKIDNKKNKIFYL